MPSYVLYNCAGVHCNGTYVTKCYVTHTIIYYLCSLTMMPSNDNSYLNPSSMTNIVWCF